MKNVRPLTPDEMAAIPAIQAIVGGGDFGYCMDCDGLRTIAGGKCSGCQRPLAKAIPPGGDNHLD